MDERTGLKGPGTARATIRSGWVHRHAPFTLSLVAIVLSSMLLMLGVACATDKAAPAPATTSYTDSTALLAASGNPPEMAHIAPGSTSTPLSDGLGTALCSITVLCGALLLVISARWRQPSSTSVPLSRFACMTRALPRVDIRVTTLTLTQLRVSRT